MAGTGFATGGVSAFACAAVPFACSVEEVKLLNSGPLSHKVLSETSAYTAQKKMSCDHSDLLHAKDMHDITWTPSRYMQQTCKKGHSREHLLLVTPMQTKDSQACLNKTLAQSSAQCTQHAASKFSSLHLMPLVISMLSMHTGALQLALPVSRVATYCMTSMCAQVHSALTCGAADVARAGEEAWATGTFTSCGAPPVAAAAF